MRPWSVGKAAEALRGERLLPTLMEHKDKLLWGAIVVVGGLVLLGYVSKRNAERGSGAQWEYLQALYLFQNGDTANAVVRLDSIAKTYGNTDWGRRALYYLGYNNLQRGDPQRAEDYYARFLASKPHDELLEAAANAALGSISLDRGDTAGALERLKRAVELTPYDTYRAHFATRIAAIYEHTGRDEEALSAYREVAKQFEDTPAAASAKERIEYLRARIGARGGS